MDKIIRFLITLIVMLTFLGLCGLIETRYTMNGTITKVNDKTCRVVDSVGEEWLFYGDGYYVGQNVKIKFNNMATDNRNDDIVINVKGL